eukprot:scaffold90348_cov51-Cyclotella_meneghiniana.AAC.1
MKLSTLATIIMAVPSAAVSLTKTSCDGDFISGVYLGAEVAENIWDERGGSCSNIHSFESQVEDYLYNNYPTDTNDWRKNSCHEGMTKGAEQVVDKYEEECSRPTNRPTPRPIDRTNGSYEDGVAQGKKEAKRIWSNNGGSCSYVWSFQDDVNDMLDDKYYEYNRYNQGVADGANEVVRNKERSCLNNSPDECNDLGFAASQAIAYDFCPYSAQEGAGAYSSPPNYKESCRSVAYGVCQGALKGDVESNGCSISSGELSKLMEECYYQVDSMTGGAVAKVISFNEEKVAVPKNSIKVAESVKTATKSSKSHKTPAPVPSPSFPVSDLSVGAEVAEDLWADGGSSCSNIGGFEEDLDAYLAENYPTDTSDSSTNSCNKSIAQAAARVAEKLEARLCPGDDGITSTISFIRHRIII